MRVRKMRADEERDYISRTVYPPPSELSNSSST